MIRHSPLRRTGDYDAVWIFMDKDITVPASDIANLIAYAQQDLLSGGKNYDNLDAFVQAAYPANPFLDIETVQKSEQAGLPRLRAKVLRIHITADIINRDLNQNYYKHYDAVFFLTWPRPRLNPSIRSQLADPEQHAL